MVDREVVFLSGHSDQGTLDSGRVVAMLIQKASAFASDIRLEVDGRRANAKSLLGVMSLSLDEGVEVTVSASGPDEDDALEALSTYLENPSVQ